MNIYCLSSNINILISIFNILFLSIGGFLYKKQKSQYYFLKNSLDHSNYLFLINKNGKLLYVNKSKLRSIFDIDELDYQNIGDIKKKSSNKILLNIIDTLLNIDKFELSKIEGYNIYRYTVNDMCYFAVKFDKNSIFNTLNKKSIVFITDKQNIIHYYNENAKTFFNLNKKQILNKNINNIIKFRESENKIDEELNCRIVTNINENEYISYIYKKKLFDYHFINPYLTQITAFFSWKIYLENIPFPVFVIDNNGVLIKHNDKFNKILSDYKNDSSQITDDIITIFDNPKEIRENINNVMMKNTKAHLQIKTKNAQNSFMLYMHKSYFNNIQNNSVTCILIDITEQKNLEESFIHSQKMQAIGQLSGGIAHDFNNLLTAMIGFCDLLLMRHPKGDPSFVDIMQIKQNANRAANLVRQLLALSRKQVLQPKIINITEVLMELSYLIKRLIGEDIELSIDHGKNLCNTKVDQGQLEQVLINIIVNARDAMQSKGLLSIKTSNIQIKNNDEIFFEKYFNPSNEKIKLGDYLLIELSDNGSGIDSKNIQKIFDPFFSTKKMDTGMGLGLSTAHGIIKQTGGYILVHSTINTGTTFIILLPKTTESETQKNTEELMTTKDLTGNENILIVEDESNVRTLIANILRNKGYIVSTAESGVEAIEIFKNTPKIDILITDVAMPGMKGTELMKRIKEIDPKIKVILMSGYAANNLEDQSIVGSDFIFLSKPFTFRDLGMAVKKLIEQKQYHA